MFGRRQPAQHHQPGMGQSRHLPRGAGVWRDCEALGRRLAGQRAGRPQLLRARTSPRPGKASRRLARSPCGPADQPGVMQPAGDIGLQEAALGRTSVAEQQPSRCADAARLAAIRARGAGSFSQPLLREASRAATRWEAVVVARARGSPGRTSDHERGPATTARTAPDASDQDAALTKGERAALFTGRRQRSSCRERRAVAASRGLRSGSGPAAHRAGRPRQERVGDGALFYLIRASRGGCADAPRARAPRSVSCLAPPQRGPPWVGAGVDGH